MTTISQQFDASRALPSAVIEYSREKLRQRRVRMGSAHSPIGALLRHGMMPLLASSTLLLTLYFFKEPLSTTYLALALMVFAISGQVLTPPPHGDHLPRLNWLARALPRLTMEWACMVGLMLFIGFALKISALYSRKVILTWCIAGPVLILLFESIKVRLARICNGGIADTQRYIIVGANELGLELHRRTQSLGHSQLLGYFDDRARERLPSECHAQLLGKQEDVLSFVQKHAIEAVYITLPVATNPRMVKLIQELRDTTASIYVVPLVLGFDTIQARMIEIDGLPVVSIYDTPLDGTRAISKRAMDIAFAGLTLLLIWPVLAAIALGVKLSSRGPILFKQRRYGLNGEEIQVYKFRSMTVCEDGSAVKQATRSDARITPFGRFLRRTSLDELPQIINVLEGKMSLVGPRPHAVAHNEQYRKLIEGYMFRHKVRPGITGWAQVNGLRGETETVDKMRQRIEYDLDYLRHWSIWMDIKIVLKTARVLFGDAKAY